jgi:short-subunit dehydrogenase
VEKYRLTSPHKVTKMLVIITGASRGIGFELVKEFSKNSQNMIIAVSRNVASLQRHVSSHNTHAILPVKADISSDVGRKKILSLVRSLKLPVNILINNAAQLLNKPVMKIDLKELNAIYNTNVFSPFALIQLLVPHFSGHGPAHIVNIGSMGGFQGSAKFSGLSAYSSSKGALAILSECLAEELKDYGITVNCLALGSVQTEMLAAAFPGYKTPLKSHQMAEFICVFASTGQKFFNGKILPVSISTP